MNFCCIRRWCHVWNDENHCCEGEKKHMKYLWFARKGRSKHCLIVPPNQTGKYQMRGWQTALIQYQKAKLQCMWSMGHSLCLVALFVCRSSVVCAQIGDRLARLPKKPCSLTKQIRENDSCELFQKLCWFTDLCSFTKNTDTKPFLTHAIQFLQNESKIFFVLVGNSDKEQIKK